MIRTYNNIVIFNSETGTYSEFPQNGISMSEKSVNGLEYDVNTDSIFISTISETGSNSELFCFQNGTWIQLSNPPPQNSHTLTILFNSLHLSGDSLFALAYYSITGSLSDSSVSFYLLSWNLATLLDRMFCLLPFLLLLPSPSLLLLLPSLFLSLLFLFSLFHLSLLLPFPCLASRLLPLSLPLPLPSPPFFSLSSFVFSPPSPSLSSRLLPLPFRFFLCNDANV